MSCRMLLPPGEDKRGSIVIVRAAENTLQVSMTRDPTSAVTESVGRKKLPHL